MPPTHYWDDDEDKFDWKALNDGMNIMVSIMRFARIGVHYKEKYGTARVSCYFYDGSLHSFTHPGYVYSQYPKWLWTADIYYIGPFFRFLRFPRFVQFFQRRFYTLAYYVAMKKYPHVAEELCVCADWPELIIGGKKIHDKHWVTHKSE